VVGDFFLFCSSSFQAQQQERECSLVEEPDKLAPKGNYGCLRGWVQCNTPRVVTLKRHRQIQGCYSKMLSLSVVDFVTTLLKDLLLNFFFGPDLIPLDQKVFELCLV